MTETYNQDRRRHRQRSAASRSLFTPIESATYNAYSNEDNINPTHDISDTSTLSLTSVLNHDSYATEPSPANSNPTRKTPPEQSNTSNAHATPTSPKLHVTYTPVKVEDISHAHPNAVSTPISSSTPINSATSTTNKSTNGNNKCSPNTNTFNHNSNTYTPIQSTKPTTGANTYTDIDEDDTLHETPECGDADGLAKSYDSDYDGEETISRSMDDLNISEVQRLLDDDETTKIVQRALKFVH